MHPLGIVIPIVMWLWLRVVINVWCVSVCSQRIPMLIVVVVWYWVSCGSQSIAWACASSQMITVRSPILGGLLFWFVYRGKRSSIVFI